MMQWIHELSTHTIKHFFITQQSKSTTKKTSQHGQLKRLNNT